MTYRLTFRDFFEIENNYYFMNFGGFSSIIVKKISVEEKEFLENMLKLQPEERPTADEAFEIVERLK